MFELSQFSLEGKVALVTGASRGIGYATALGFANLGADVAITSRKQPDLDAAAVEIRQTGRKVLPIASHGGRMENHVALVDAVVKEFGKLDILVNNAATSPAVASVLDTEERLWDTMMNVNLKGLYFLSQAAAQVMKEQGGGKIVNVSSIEGTKPGKARSVYSIGKAAVIMLTKSFAAELAPYNIRVNAIAPGAIETKMLNNMWTHLPQEEQESIRTDLNERIPLGHIADPDEMVGAMIYMASDASSFLTGQTLLIDGGVSVS